MSFNRQCKEHIGHSKHTRGCCKTYTRGCCNNVSHWSAVSLPGIANNTNGIQNTPEGVVRCMTIIRCFIVLSLLQESHQTHLLNKKTPEGGVKILQGYCVFLLGKARNTHYFLTSKRVTVLFVTSSWILKEIVRNIWKTQKECWKCVTLKYYNIQQSNTRDCCEMYYTDGRFYWKICVTTIYIQEGDI